MNQKMWKNMVKVLAVTSLLTVSLVACSSSNNESSKTGKTIATSLYPVEFIAKSIAGDDFSVINVTPAGSEAHDFELSPSQTEKLLNADLAIVLGRSFQPSIEAVAQSRDSKTVVVTEELKNNEQAMATIIPARIGHAGHDHNEETPQDENENIAPEDDDHEEEGHTHISSGDDPHIWLDPITMISMVDVVADSIADINPNGKKLYRENAQNLKDSLTELDKMYKNELSSCELDIFITSHDAFSLLAQRYDITQESIAGISPENEPAPKRLTQLANLVKKHNIEIIFTEELVSQKVAETLSSEAGVKTKILSPLESLTSEQVDNGDDYFSLMRANLIALSQGLRCDRV